MINKLYQEVLLEHNRAPYHYGAPAHYCCQGKAYNPTCGDDLDVYLVAHEPILHGVYFAGEACAVSTASASLMTQVLEGLTTAQAIPLCQRFIQAVEEGKELNLPAPQARQLQPLLAVREFPGRHGCAVLPWKAVLQILQADSHLAISA